MNYVPRKIFGQVGENVTEYKGKGTASKFLLFLNLKTLLYHGTNE
jgi:hypothetical protein